MAIRIVSPLNRRRLLKTLSSVVLLAGADGVARHAIYVRPESRIRRPEDLAGVPIAVGLMAGSHYNVPYRLERYLPLAEIKIEPVGGFGRRLDALLKGGLGNRADNLVDDLAILDEEDRRDGPDPGTSRQRGALVDADLNQLHSTVRGQDQVVEDRRDRVADALFVELRELLPVVRGDDVELGLRGLERHAGLEPHERRKLPGVAEISEAQGRVDVDGLRHKIGRASCRERV